MTKYQLFTDRHIGGAGPQSPLLVVGEAPGEEEYNEGIPFIGYSGQILRGVLARHGMPSEDVRLDNISPYRPWNNQFVNLLNTPYLEEGLKNIHAYIRRTRPVAIATTGNYPTYYLTGKGTWRTVNGIKTVSGIGHWRGSILPYVDETGTVHEDIKVIPTYHPAAVGRKRELYPIFDLDIKKAIDESKFRGLNYPQREIIRNPRGMDLEQLTQQLCNEPILAVDIEAIKRSTHILCVGFAPRPDFGVVIVPDAPDTVRAVDRILGSRTKKVFQFGTYDTTMLGLNGYTIAKDSKSEELDREYYWDTLIAQHVLEPELPRGLDYLTSVYTRQPYYKHTGKQEFPGDVKGWSNKINRDALYVYNGIDVCVDIDIALQQADEIHSLPQSAQDIFNFEMNELELVRHIGLSGMLVDQERMNMFKGAMIAKWAKLQVAVDMVTGFEVNVRSPKLKHILYDKDKVNLPERRKRDGTVTTDDDALVYLIGYCRNHIATLKRDDAIRKWTLKLAVVKAIREIREIRTRLSMYVLARIDDDGRTRATYKLAATETGRWSSQTFVNGVGYNHQTNPRDPITVSDEDYERYKNEVRLLEQLDETDLAAVIGDTIEEDEAA